jgi:hypothetical protein
MADGLRLQANLLRHKIYDLELHLIEKWVLIIDVANRWPFSLLRKFGWEH